VTRSSEGGKVLYIAAAGGGRSGRPLIGSAPGETPCPCRAEACERRLEAANSATKISVFSDLFSPQQTRPLQSVPPPRTHSSSRFRNSTVLNSPENRHSSQWHSFPSTWRTCRRVGSPDSMRQTRLLLRASPASTAISALDPRSQTEPLTAVAIAVLCSVAQMTGRQPLLSVPPRSVQM